MQATPLLPRLALASAFSALALGATPSAQCYAPDGLSGPCCTNATPSLPSFPGVNVQGVGLCWESCSLDDSECIDIFTSPFLQTGCESYEAQISIQNCAGEPMMSGFPLVLDYTRTWRELDDAGNEKQVWRFVAKVDMNPGLVDGCPVPNSIATGGLPSAFFYGYADQVRDCATGTWESALVLFHNNDLFIHDQSHSSLPGTYDPDRTYAIVGPDTVANPFDPSPVLKTGGALAGEAMRNTDPAVSVCLTEERIGAGVYAPIINLCVAPLAFGSIKNTFGAFSGEGTCVGASGSTSSFTSINTLPVGFPWFNNLTTSIGSWTTTATYPGDEAAFVEEGVYLYHDSCSAAPPFTSGDSLDFFYGASTQGGWFAETDFGIPMSSFTDMASNYSQDLPGAIVPPFTGTVLPTRHLIYTNIF